MGLIKFVAMPTEDAESFWRGAPDAYGNKPEHLISKDGGEQCRHCLRAMRPGEAHLVLAYRPFPDLQPYAETGPVFLCAEPCERAPQNDVLPDIFRASPHWILRGYGANNRILYGTGAVTESNKICSRAHELLQRDDVSYVHLRSARNNCYQVRIERAA